MLEEGASAAADLGLGAVDDLRRLESNGRLDADVDAVSSRARERGMSSMGTLGSGNHFAELQAVEEVVDGETAEAWGSTRAQLVAMITPEPRAWPSGVHGSVRHLERQFVSDDGGWRHEGYDWWIPDRRWPLHLDTPPRPSIPRCDGCCGQLRLREQGGLGATPHHRVGGPHTKRVEWSTVYDVAHNIAKDEEHVIDGKRHVQRIEKARLEPSWAA